MKLRFALAALYIAVLLDAQGQGIKFENGRSWKDILANAKSENKLILVDAFTTWCGPCKDMSERTFPDQDLGDYVNDKFISVKVQMDKTPIDNENTKNWYYDAQTLEKQHEINSYPTVIFLDAHGKLISRAVGFRDARNLITEAKKAIALNGEYGAAIKSFKQGKMDTAALRELVVRAREISDWQTIEAVSVELIKRIPEPQLFKKEHLVFFGSHLTTKSKYFNLFLTHAKKVNRLMSKNYAQSSVMQAIYRAEILPHENETKPDWEGIERKVVAKYGPLAQEQVWGSRLLYYRSAHDWANFGKYYKLYFDIAVPEERSFIHINNISWVLFEHVSDSAVLNTAIKAMSYNLDKFQRYDHQAIDTYANLLYKAFQLHGVGTKDNALGWYDRAVRLSNRDKQFVETFEKMQAGQPTWPLIEKK
jgi:thioredoxin-related protein